VFDVSQRLRPQNTAGQRNPDTLMCGKAKKADNGGIEQPKSRDADELNTVVGSMIQLATKETPIFFKAFVGKRTAQIAPQK